MDIHDDFLNYVSLVPNQSRIGGFPATADCACWKEQLEEMEHRCDQVGREL